LTNTFVKATTDFFLFSISIKLMYNIYYNLIGYFTCEVNNDIFVSE